jgi:hypothetical protein
LGAGGLIFYGRSCEGKVLFAEEFPFESFEFVLVFLIKDYSDSVDLFGMVCEERLHEGVVKGIAEIRKGMHDFDLVLIDVQITLPLLVVASSKVDRHIAISL